MFILPLHGRWGSVGVHCMLQARQSRGLCVWAEAVHFLSHMNLSFFATLCYPQAPPESTWDGGAGLQHIHDEGEVCKDEGGCPKARGDVCAFSSPGRRGAGMGLCPGCQQVPAPFSCPVFWPQS